MQPVVIGDVIWEPSPEVIARSRLKRFMDQHGIETFPELLKRADENIEWFWDAAIKDIDIAFFRHYDRVLDLTHGKPWAQRWIGGRMNIVQSCLDRHRDREFHDKVALIWEGEPGDVRRLTYGELDKEVCRLAGALRNEHPALEGLRPDGRGLAVALAASRRRVRRRRGAGAAQRGIRVLPDRVDLAVH